MSDALSKGPNPNSPLKGTFGFGFKKGGTTKLHSIKKSNKKSNW